MRKKFFIYTTFTFLIAGLILGFTNLNDKPVKSIDPESSRTAESKSIDSKKIIDLNKSNVFENDNNGGGFQTSGLPYYTDNFDNTNDTTSLKNRGYKVYYRGGGTQGITATWFQGGNGGFSSYNGPANGFVAANYQVVSGTNNIDSWLVLPKKSVTAGDSIVFYSNSSQPGQPSLLEMVFLLPRMKPCACLRIFPNPFYFSEI